MVDHQVFLRTDGTVCMSFLKITKAIESTHWVTILALLQATLSKHPITGYHSVSGLTISGRQSK